MRGEIKDFSESLRRRVAMLEGVPADALERVYHDRLRLNPGAESLVATARDAGVKVMLVSGGFTFFTERLRERLQPGRSPRQHAGNRRRQAHRAACWAISSMPTPRPPICATSRRAMARRRRSRSSPWATAPTICKMLALAGYSVAYHAKPVVRPQGCPIALNVCGLDAVLNWFGDRRPSPLYGRRKRRILAA